MTADWKDAILDDLVDIVHGWPFKSAEFVEGADDLPTIVSIGNFDYAGGFRFNTTTRKGYKGAYPEAYELQPGDLLLVMTCQTAGGEILGIPGRVPDDGHVYLHNQRIGKVVLKDPSAISLDFVFQLARWKVFNRALFASSSGSKILHTSPDRIEAFRFRLPPPDEQEEIAITLGALDDKIESNRRLITVIPSLIAARVAEALGRSAEPTPVARLARFVNGGAYTKGATGTGRMVIRIVELNTGPGLSTVYNDLDVPPDRLVLAGDLLMSWSGSLGVYRWAREEAIVNQHIFKVIPEGFPAWLVHDRLRHVMPDFRAIAKDKATTMGHIQRGHLESTIVAMPEPREVQKLDEDLRPLWDRLLLAERESLRLAELRDVLLAELLSGRIRAPQPHEVVEAAV